MSAPCRLLLSLLLLLCSAPALAQAPPPAPLVVQPGFGGLCDGGPLPCTRIDLFAFHVGADILVVSQADAGPAYAVLPFAASVAFGERGEVGLGSALTLYPDGAGGLGRGLSPWHFDAKALLHPLLSSHPHQRTTLVVHLSYELRAGAFDGPNALGLQTDLAAARLLLNWPLGRAELGLSAGALWHRDYGAGELGARAALHLPIADLKVFAEAMVRGWPAVVRTTDPLPGALDPATPLRPAWLLALGLVSRPVRSLDFAVVATVGGGSAPPLTVNVRILDLGLGHGYPRPAALLSDMLGELGSWVRARLANIDPTLKKNCVLIDDDGKTPMGNFGTLTPDGKACRWRGQTIPTEVRLWRDPDSTRVCRDARLRDCFLVRPNNKAPWEPAPTPLVGADCFLRENGQVLARLGTPTEGGGCERDGHVVQQGQELWHELGTQRVCDAPPGPGQSMCLELPRKGQPLSQVEYQAARVSGGVDGSLERKEAAGGAVRQVINEAAQGVPVVATTPVRQAVQTARNVIEAARQATVADAKRAFDRTLDRIDRWAAESTQEKVGDVAEVAGGAAVDAPLDALLGAGAGHALGAVVGGVREVGEGAKVAEKAAQKAGKGARRAEQAAAQRAERAAEHAPAGHAGQVHPAAPAPGVAEHAPPAGHAQVHPAAPAPGVAEHAPPAPRKPNPFGSPGKPDHQAKVEAMKEEFKTRYKPPQRVEVNKSIKGETGVNRRPDVSAWDDRRPIGKRVLEVGEAARTNKDGKTFVPRERKKVDEYNRAGIPFRMEPVK